MRTPVVVVAAGQLAGIELDRRRVGIAEVDAVAGVVADQRPVLVDVGRRQHLDRQAGRRGQRDHVAGPAVIGGHEELVLEVAGLAPLGAQLGAQRRDVLGQPLVVGAQLGQRTTATCGHEQRHDDDRPARPRARPEGLRDLPTSTALRDPPPPPRPAADDAALALYRKGQAALKVRDHAAAIEAFRALIGQHPTHDYADNAQYWIGEAYYDQKDYARAVSEFRATVAAYPLGNKVPDALVKIGLAYAALGETAKARAALAQVVRQFPKTAPAAIAATRLEQLP